MIRILVAEPHPALRAELSAALGGDPDLVVVGTAATAADVVRAAGTHPCDVALVAHNLPDTTGAQACQRLRSRHPDVQVVVMLPAARDVATLTALAAGAAGIVVKGSDPAAARAAVRVVAAGGVHLDPAVAGIVVGRALGRGDDVVVDLASARERARVR